MADRMGMGFSARTIADAAVYEVTASMPTAGQRRG